MANLLYNNDEDIILISVSDNLASKFSYDIIYIFLLNELINLYDHVVL